MKGFTTISLFCLMTALMGFVAAACVWCVLRLLSCGRELIWSWLPTAAGLEGNPLFTVAVCLAGGLLIGLWQRRYGPLPDRLEEVMLKIKKDGGYPYDKLPIVIVAMLMPLLFGGAVGPEAGLSGIIAGLCCWIGDRLKYKGEQLSALSEAGIATTLAVIFGAPLFGIVANLEPGDKGETYKEKLLSKRSRIIVYCFGVLGGMLAFALLGNIFGGRVGLPRFGAEHAVGFDQWKWFIPLVAIGILFSLYYQCMGKLTSWLRNKLGDRMILSCLIAGAALALCGIFLPMSMFSGEDELSRMIDTWPQFSVKILLLTALAKLLMVNVCVNFGWKGGNIFPVIFSSSLIGYSFALLTGMDGAFAVAVVTASLYAYFMRKPATVVAVLLLCFPITYIFPLSIAALIAAKVPTPVKNHV